MKTGRVTIAGRLSDDLALELEEHYTDTHVAISRPRMSTRHGEDVVSRVTVALRMAIEEPS